MEFTGSTVKFGLNVQAYRHKIIRQIAPESVPAFYLMCRNVADEAAPTYKMFYAGQFYDRSGTFTGSAVTGQRMTCVGFCLSVLKGFFTEDYLDYSGWDHRTPENDGYVENFCKKNQFDIDAVRAEHRRITPDELLASAYFDKRPISKSEIDSIIEKVRKALVELQ